MILQADPGRSFKMLEPEIKMAVNKVLESGWYILGKEVSAFEEEWADYIGSKYCVGLASGLDALWMSFRLLDIKEGDEVIVCANAYIACVMGITMNGATPVFVEPDEYDNIDADAIEAAITDKTKAIILTSPNNVRLYTNESSSITIESNIATQIEMGVMTQIEFLL